MKLVKSTALLLIILPLIGSIFACVFFWAVMRGTFTKWEILSQPASTPVKLIRMNFVQTITGEIYEFQYSEQCPNRCWVKVETVPSILNTTDLLPIENCRRSFDIPSINRFSDAVIECWRSGTGIRVDVQAINREGNIQMWQEGQDDFGDALMLTTFPVFGAFGGLLIALILFIIVLIRAVIVNRPQRKTRTTRTAPIKCSPTKHARDAGESVAISSNFLRLSIFLVGRLRRPCPSAGNANRWALSKVLE